MLDIVSQLRSKVTELKLSSANPMLLTGVDACSHKILNYDNSRQYMNDYTQFTPHISLLAHTECFEEQ